MTSNSKIKILILDDEKQFTEELHEFFQNSGFEAFASNTNEEAQIVLAGNEIDLLILDVRLPGINGLDILKDVKAKYPSTEVIVVSAHGDMDTVIKAMRLGAFDYIRKPFRHLDIQIAIKRTQKYMEIQQRLKVSEERNSLISKALEQKIDRQFIGISSQIREVFNFALKAANYPDANVLITGESGTGKENIARIIHFSSPRKDYLFCAVNSSAITDSLQESEFFGHKKGSFTGAVNDKMGFFEVSNMGTLFLDEIADMRSNLQAMILRAIEEKVITRVGDTHAVSTDFRVISATNHDINKSVEKKEFRLDLLHRLNTLHIHIPPLRERPEDIKPLVIHFANMFSIKLNKPDFRISNKVFDALMKYSFPGNVRELKNITERAIILSQGNTLEVSDFLIKPQKPELSDSGVESFDLKTNELFLVRKALEKAHFNQQEAADALGIHRDALGRKIKKYNITIGKIEE